MWGRDLKSWGVEGSLVSERAQGSGRRTVRNLGPDHTNMGAVITSGRDCRDDGRPGAKSAPNSSQQVLVFGAVRSFPDSLRMASGPAKPGFEGCHAPAG